MSAVGRAADALITRQDAMRDSACTRDDRIAAAAAVLDGWAQVAVPERITMDNGEVLPWQTVVARYEELRVLQANRTEWLPLWKWVVGIFALIGMVGVLWAFLQQSLCLWLP